MVKNNLMPSLWKGMSVLVKEGEKDIEVLLAEDTLTIRRDPAPGF